MDKSGSDQEIEDADDHDTADDEEELREDEDETHDLSSSSNCPLSKRLLSLPDPIPIPSVSASVSASCRGAVRLKRRGGCRESWASRFCFALLFWNQIWMHRLDMDSLSANVSRMWAVGFGHTSKTFCRIEASLAVSRRRLLITLLTGGGSRGRAEDRWTISDRESADPELDGL